MIYYDKKGGGGLERPQIKSCHLSFMNVSLFGFLKKIHTMGQIIIRLPINGHFDPQKGPFYYISDLL